MKLSERPTQQGFIILRWRGQSLLLRVYVTTHVIGGGRW
jgi:hypothetical protein